MKTIYIVSFLTLLPITSFALNQITGTDTNPDLGNDNGTLEGNGYHFNVIGRKITGNKNNNPNVGSIPPDMGLFASSSKEGQWWVAKNSAAPWETYTPETTTSNRPSFHMTDDVTGGDEFYVGLSSQYEMLSYNTQFHMVGANDIFSEDVDIYFGLKNDSGPVAGAAGFISDTQGVTFVATEDPAGASFASEFEWAHYTSDSTSGSGDILLDFTGIPALTEWVAYFVLPEGLATIDNEAWGSTPPETNDDLTFSWTISPNGYTGFDGPGGDPPTEVPGWDTPTFVPEPSSAMLLFGGIVMLLTRRNRKAA